MYILYNPINASVKPFAAEIRLISYCAVVTLMFSAPSPVSRITMSRICATCSSVSDSAERMTFTEPA